jgi:hypothetical protein
MGEVVKRPRRLQNAGARLSQPQRGRKSQRIPGVEIFLRLLVGLVLGCVVVGRGSASEVHWPQFRGPDGDGHSKARGLPLTWSETNHVKWKTPIHGKAWSSPVVWGDQIWLTTAPEDGTELFVLCVDRASGKVLRDQKLFDVAKPQFCHKFNSYASPTPVILARQRPDVYRPDVVQVTRTLPLSR